MEKSFESFKIMLNELNSSINLNEIRKNKIEELKKEIEELKRQNKCLKFDLISLGTLNDYK